MTTNPNADPSSRTTLRSPLAQRLVLAFVTVAVTAVFVFAGLTLWRTKHAVGRLGDYRRQETAEAIARTLALSYQQTQVWTTTDIHPASMLATQASATITVTDPTGHTLTLANSMGPMDTARPDPRTVIFSNRVPVTVDNTTVGIVKVGFTTRERTSPEQHVRDAIRSTIGLGALVAALVAIIVAIALSRRIVTPLVRITDAARRLGNGDADARVAHAEATGELGMLANAFDEMADRLQAHEQTRRNLTADLAHELRTPLTLLQGNCEELIDGNAKPDLAKFVDLHDDILRMRRLVDDLATLADADSATTEGTAGHEPVDLASAASDAVNRLRDFVAANNHQLLTDLQPVTVHGNRAQLMQITTNLLTNAIKYTPSGGTIRVAVAPDPATSSGVLAVADTGPGINELDRPRVFERFYRSDRTRHIAGSGIGLAVAHQLVNAHHGTITIDSPSSVETAQGTTIRVRIPTNPRKTGG